MMCAPRDPRSDGCRQRVAIRSDDYRAIDVHVAQEEGAVTINGYIARDLFHRVACYGRPRGCGSRPLGPHLCLAILIIWQYNAREHCKTCLHRLDSLAT